MQGDVGVRPRLFSIRENRRFVEDSKKPVVHLSGCRTKEKRSQLDEIVPFIGFFNLIILEALWVRGKGP
jgi:hypothetical protein